MSDNDCLLSTFLWIVNVREKQISGGGAGRQF